MNDSSEHLSIDRRKFLAGALATLSSRFLPINTIIGSPEGTSVVTPDMLAAFHENPAYRPLMGMLYELSLSHNCINHLKSFTSEAQASLHDSSNRINMYGDSEIAWNVAYFEHSGKTQYIEYDNMFLESLNDLRKAKPSLKTIVEMLSDPAFHDPSNYYFRFHIEDNAQDIEKVAKQLYEISRSTPEESQFLYEQFIKEHTDTVADMAKVAYQNPNLSEEIKKQAAEIKAKEEALEKARNISGFSDMAAARKAAMYPIPETVTDDEQKQLRIGLYAKPYASGCEHYGTIVGSRDEQLRAHYASKSAH